jgi:hypothetical protein
MKANLINFSQNDYVRRKTDITMLYGWLYQRLKVGELDHVDLTFELFCDYYMPYWVNRLEEYEVGLRENNLVNPLNVFVRLNLVQNGEDVVGLEVAPQVEMGGDMYNVDYDVPSGNYVVSSAAIALAQEDESESDSSSSDDDDDIYVNDDECLDMMVDDALVRFMKNSGFEVKKSRKGKRVYLRTKDEEKTYYDDASTYIVRVRADLRTGLIQGMKEEKLEKDSNMDLKHDKEGDVVSEFEFHEDISTDEKDETNIVRLQRSDRWKDPKEGMYHFYSGKKRNFRECKIESEREWKEKVIRVRNDRKKKIAAYKKNNANKKYLVSHNKEIAPEGFVSDVSYQIIGTLGTAMFGRVRDRLEIKYPEDNMPNDGIIHGLREANLNRLGAWANEGKYIEIDDNKVSAVLSEMESDNDLDYIPDGLPDINPNNIALARGQRLQFNLNGSRRINGEQATLHGFNITFVPRDRVLWYQNDGAFNVNRPYVSDAVNGSPLRTVIYSMCGHICRDGEPNTMYYVILCNMDSATYQEQMMKYGISAYSYNAMVLVRYLWALDARPRYDGPKLAFKSTWQKLAWHCALARIEMRSTDVAHTIHLRNLGDRYAPDMEYTDSGWMAKVALYLQVIVKEGSSRLFSMNRKYFDDFTRRLGIWVGNGVLRINQEIGHWYNSRLFDREITVKKYMRNALMVMANTFYEDGKMRASGIYFNNSMTTISPSQNISSCFVPTGSLLQGVAVGTPFQAFKNRNNYNELNTASWTTKWYVFQDANWIQEAEMRYGTMYPLTVDRLYTKDVSVDVYGRIITIRDRKQFSRLLTFAREYFSMSILTEDHSANMKPVFTGGCFQEPWAQTFGEYVSKTALRHVNKVGRPSWANVARIQDYSVPNESEVVVADADPQSSFF